MCKTTARGEGLGAYAYTARRGRSVDEDDSGCSEGVRCIKSFKSSAAANTFKKNSGVYIYIYRAITGV